MNTVDSTSDDRTVNNTMRHKYRVLTDDEKAQMQALKDKGQELLDLIEGLRTDSSHKDQLSVLWHRQLNQRHLNIAAERVEEAVMWAVKHITA